MSNPVGIEYCATCEERINNCECCSMCGEHYDNCACICEECEEIEEDCECWEPCTCGCGVNTIDCEDYPGR